MNRFIASPKASKSWQSASVALGLAILLAGCGLPTFGLVDTSTTITSEPDNAFIKVNGQNVGNTPVSYQFDFDKGQVYRVNVEKEGFHPYPVRVWKDDVKIKGGNLHLVLQEDPSWNDTTNSQATNRWLRLQVDPTIDQQDTWQKIVDSVTTAYDSLEQLDYQSGYIRSISQKREFSGGPDGDFVIRTQFLGSISSKTPLIYKFKIRSERGSKRGSSERWQPHDRVFKNDAELVEELQARLGIK